MILYQIYLVIYLIPSFFFLLMLILFFLAFFLMKKKKKSSLAQPSFSLNCPNDPFRWNLGKFFRLSKNSYIIILYQ